MNIPKLLAVCLISLALPLQAVYADTYKCVGMDGEGTKLHVLYDEDTNTINVNGQIMKVEADTKGKNGIATEDFELESGEMAYVTLVVEGDKDFILREYNAKDDSVIMTAPLACE